MTPWRSRDCVTAGGGVSLIQHSSIKHAIKPVIINPQDEKIKETKQVPPLEEERKKLENVEYLKSLSSSNGVGASKETNLYNSNTFTTPTQRDNEMSASSGFN